MKAFPYIRLTFRTASTPDVVGARIAAMITPRRFYFSRPPEPFRGTMQGTRFKVMRVLGWVRNSFQPVVIGNITQGPSGTEVRVRMRLHAAVAAFMTFWFGFLLLVGCGFIYTATTKSSATPLGVPLAAMAGMALFAYGLMSISFWSEVKRARLLLRDGLGVNDADVVED